MAGFAAWLRYALWPSLPDVWIVQSSLTPLLAAMFVVWAATLFHYAPNHRTPWKYDLPGALFTSLGWLVLVFGFAVYVRATASANGVLGLTGALLAAFTLVYLLALALLVGAEINEIIARRAGVVQQAESRPRFTLRRRSRH